jgi:hypothetical protein
VPQFATVGLAGGFLDKDAIGGQEEPAALGLSTTTWKRLRISQYLRMVAPILDESRD